MSFTEVMDDIARGFESIGVFVLILGLVASLVFAALIWRRSRDGRRAYRTLRETFGGVLLLGLEILVAADLIRTVAVAPTLENVGVLGLIVLIRTLLSFSLEIEIEGVAPWRRTTVSGATALPPQFPMPETLNKSRDFPTPWSPTSEGFTGIIVTSGRLRAACVAEWNRMPKGERSFGKAGKLLP